MAFSFGRRSFVTSSIDALRCPFGSEAQRDDAGVAAAAAGSKRKSVATRGSLATTSMAMRCVRAQTGERRSLRRLETDADFVLIFVRNASPSER